MQTLEMGMLVWPMDVPLSLQPHVQLAEIPGLASLGALLTPTPRLGPVNFGSQKEHAPTR